MFKLSSLNPSLNPNSLANAGISVDVVNRQLSSFLDSVEAEPALARFPIKMFKLFVQRMVLGRPDDTKQYSRALLGLAVK